MSEDTSKKLPPKKPIVFMDVEGCNMIVEDFDKMLSLLDQGWEVKEEHTDGFFLMIRKDTRRSGGLSG